MQYTHITRVQKFNRSIAVIIPIELARAQRIARADYVIFSGFDNGDILFRKLSDSEILVLKPKKHGDESEIKW